MVYIVPISKEWQTLSVCGTQVHTYLCSTLAHFVKYQVRDAHTGRCWSWDAGASRVRVFSLVCFKCWCLWSGHNYFCVLAWWFQLCSVYSVLFVYYRCSSCCCVGYNYWDWVVGKTSLFCENAITPFLSKNLKEFSSCVIFGMLCMMLKYMGAWWGTVGGARLERSAFKKYMVLSMPRSFCLRDQHCSETTRLSTLTNCYVLCTDDNSKPVLLRELWNQWGADGVGCQPLQKILSVRNNVQKPT